MVNRNLSLKDTLQEYFGFSNFKGEQEAIVRTLLDGNDTFVIMPTGGGKSLCYQLPALISEGTAIVISPLIALMKNQVDLVRGYSSNDSIAHFLNSSLSRTEQKKVKEDILVGKTKLLYVAPETLVKEETINFFREIKVSFVAVDEAHCISEWGHDFRPEYRRIREMIAAIDASMPVIALTATATPKVRSDIMKTLEMRAPKIFISSFNRANLYYEIRHRRTDAEGTKQIVQFIKKNADKSGIIYVIHRKTAEKIAEVLQVNGIKAEAYHAGIDNKTRARTQDLFLMQEIDVIVATIAFGMGIDKPDIRFVIHYEMAKSLENYYQETGRAGRDGLEGRCISFFSYKDITKFEKLMKDKSVAEKERANQLIDDTVGYMESGDCRRKYLLHYFGEDFDQDNCENCDNCLNPKEKVEAIEHAKLALKAILELKENYIFPYVVKVIMGSKNKEIEQFQHNNLATFGKGSDKDEVFWNSILRQLLVGDYIKKEVEQFGTLRLTEKGHDLLNNGRGFQLILNHNYEEGGEAVDLGGSGKALADEALLSMLKDLRKQVAKKHNLPPYVIFQDASLDDMATLYPVSSDEFANITGVSKGKALRYGKEFSELIKKYVEENDIERPDDFVMKSVVKKSGNKVKIIKSLDKKLPLEDIASDIGVQKHEVIIEMETIVNSGTKINIDYILNDVIDEELVEEIYEYFTESDSDSIDAALEEFEDEELEYEDMQLVRIKFLSEMAN